MKNAIWLFIICLGVLFVFIPSYTQMQDLKKKNAEYDRQIVLLEAKRDELKEEIRLLKEDPEYLEKVAREKMGLIKKGEVQYKITEINSE